MNCTSAPAAARMMALWRQICASARHDFYPQHGWRPPPGNRSPRPRFSVESEDKPLPAIRGNVIISRQLNVLMARRGLRDYANYPPDFDATALLNIAVDPAFQRRGLSGERCRSGVIDEVEKPQGAAAAG